MATEEDELESESGPRSFAVFIREICSGEIEKEAAATMQSLLSVLEDEATQKAGKAKGSLNLTLAFEVDNKGNCSVAFNVEKKEPKKLRGGGVCWIGSGSNYSLDPPRRRQGIREVEKPTKAMAEPAKRSARSV
jgi:hypothetical protein